MDSDSDDEGVKVLPWALTSSDSSPKTTTFLSNKSVSKIELSYNIDLDAVIGENMLRTSPPPHTHEHTHTHARTRLLFFCVILDILFNPLG
jgi:hypothetical protein